MTTCSAGRVTDHPHGSSCHRGVSARCTAMSTTSDASPPPTVPHQAGAGGRLGRAHRLRRPLLAKVCVHSLVRSSAVAGGAVGAGAALRAGGGDRPGAPGARPCSWVRIDGRRWCWCRLNSTRPWSGQLVDGGGGRGACLGPRRGSGADSGRAGAVRASRRRRDRRGRRDRGAASSPSAVTSRDPYPRPRRVWGPSRPARDHRCRGPGGRGGGLHRGAPRAAGARPRSRASGTWLTYTQSRLRHLRLARRSSWAESR